MSESQFAHARKVFHASLLKNTLTTNDAGVVSNADSNNTSSKAIAKGIAELLKAETISERGPGQTSGNQFETICAEFIQSTFLQLGHLRPGKWDVHQVSGRNRLEIAKAIRSFMPASHVSGRYGATAHKTPGPKR